MATYYANNHPGFALIYPARLVANADFESAFTASDWVIEAGAPVLSTNANFSMSGSQSLYADIGTGATQTGTQARVSQKIPVSSMKATAGRALYAYFSYWVAGGTSAGMVKATLQWLDASNVLIGTALTTVFDNSGTDRAVVYSSWQFTRTNAFNAGAAIPVNAAWLKVSLECNVTAGDRVSVYFDFVRVGHSVDSFDCGPAMSFMADTLPFTPVPDQSAWETENNTQGGKLFQDGYRLARFKTTPINDASAALVDLMWKYCYDGTAFHYIPKANAIAGDTRLAIIGNPTTDVALNELAVGNANAFYIDKAIFASKKRGLRELEAGLFNWEQEIQEVA